MQSNDGTAMPSERHKAGHGRAELGIQVAHSSVGCAECKDLGWGWKVISGKAAQSSGTRMAFNSRNKDFQAVLL